jgi:hypothetical protein
MFSQESREKSIEKARGADKQFWAEQPQVAEKQDFE